MKSKPGPVQAVAIILAAVALAGCGGSGSDGIDAELTVRTLLEEELVKQGMSTGDLRDIGCVEQSDTQFQCVVTVAEGGQEQRVAGTLTCDSSDQCVWRGQFVGG